MYETNDLRKGLRIEIDKVPYRISETHFVKPGKGNAFVRVKMKNLMNGTTLDRTWKSGEKISKAAVTDTKMQFLYADGETYHFMDQSSYEQIEISKDQVGDGWKWLVEQMDCEVSLYDGVPIDVTWPNFTILEITYCEPGVKGDTATNVSMPATLSTGAEIAVPLFVNQGDSIKIDTRTGEYAERAKV